MACAALVLAGEVHAERPRTYAITGASIVTAPGEVVANGTLVLRDGLIEAVGSDVAVPTDAEVIAAEKHWTVYAAMIDAASSVGLDTDAPVAPGSARPRGGEEPRRMGAPHELKAVHPEAAVVDQLDPAHASVARHREMGFAAAHVLPLKGVFRGESALLTLREGPAPELIQRARLAQVVALETSSFMARQYPSSKFGAVAAVRQALLDAGRQDEWNQRYAANPAGLEPPEYRASDAALLAVLRGERPPVFVALSGLDPARFDGLAREFGLRGITVARGLGDRPADLANARMPVLLPLELPEKPKLEESDDLIEAELEQMQVALAAPRLPAALDAAGVAVAFVTAGMKNPRRFTENLAAVVKAGLPADKALAAVTTTPAQLLGVSAAMGTLAPGKLAHVMVVAGDLFGGKPELRHLFVEGYHEEFKPEKSMGDPNAVVDPRGRWLITTEVMGRSSESTWTIDGEPGAWNGSSESTRAGKRDFSSVELKGNALTVVSPGPAGEMKLTVIISGGTLSGQTTMESERGSVGMKVEGRRAAGPQGGGP